MTIVSICALSLMAAQAEGPRILAPPGWSTKSEIGKVTMTRGIDDGLGSATVVLLASQKPADLELELLKRGIMPMTPKSAKFKFLNDKGAEFTMQVLNGGGAPTLLLNTPSGEGFKDVLVNLPTGSADGLLQEVSGLVGPWLAETRTDKKEHAWQSPDGKSGGQGKAEAHGDDTFTLVEGNSGDGWSWGRSVASASSSSSNSSNNSGGQSNGGSQTRQQSGGGGGSNSSVAIDPGNGSMTSGPITKDPSGVAPGGMILNSSILRLPTFPKVKHVKFDLEQDGSFTLTPSGDGAKAVKGRCVDDMNGYKLVDSNGKPLGITLQILQTYNGPVASLNGLLLHRAE
jgi:hypothetical protein